MAYGDGRDAATDPYDRNDVCAFLEMKRSQNLTACNQQCYNDTSVRRLRSRAALFLHATRVSWSMLLLLLLFLGRGYSSYPHLSTLSRTGTRLVWMVVLALSLG